MLKRSHSEQLLASGSVPLSLASILLVEADANLRDSRRLLLGSLQHPVLAVTGYTEICTLPSDSNCCLVVIGLAPSEHEAVRVAIHSRRSWPLAKILLLGHPSSQFDDPLYDDAVDPSFAPAELIATVNLLLKNRYQQV
jgi:DNA-binding response OmpR family regulator